MQQQSLLLVPSFCEEDFRKAMAPKAKKHRYRSFM